MLPRCIGLSWVVVDPLFFWTDMDSYWCLGHRNNLFFPGLAVCCLCSSLTCMEMYSMKSLWVSGSWWSLWDLAVGMGGRGFRILLCRVCFQQPAQPAPDGPGMYEEEVGHIEAGEQGVTAIFVWVEPEWWRRTGEDQQPPDPAKCGRNKQLSQINNVWYHLPIGYIFASPIIFLISPHPVSHPPHVIELFIALSMHKYSGMLTTLQKLNYGQLYFSALFETAVQKWWQRNNISHDCISLSQIGCYEEFWTSSWSCDKGHTGVMWWLEAPCRDKNQVQMANESWSLALIWVSCGLLLSSCTPIRSLPISPFLVCTGRVWGAACSPTVLWGLLVMFPSLQRYQQWFQWKDQCCLSNAAEGTEGSNLTAGMHVPTKSVS